MRCIFINDAKVYKGIHQCCLGQQSHISFYPVSIFDHRIFQSFFILQNICCRWCVQQDNDQLSKSSVSCLENLVLTNRPKMNRETEHTVLNFLSEIVTGKLFGPPINNCSPTQCLWHVVYNSYYFNTVAVKQLA